MTRLTSILFAFIAVVFLTASAWAQQGTGASTQRQRASFGLIQGDYDRYARLFKEGKDPDFTDSDTWRRLYTSHQWNAFAAGSEFREPLLTAQTLMGIWMISHMDTQLTGQITDVIMSKAGYGAVLSENMSLDIISSYLSRSEDPVVVRAREEAESGRSFRSPMEEDRMMMLNRELDVEVRRAIVNPTRLGRARLNEVRSLENRFLNSETDWVSRYYFMRERLNLLDELAAYFPFNWSGEEGEAHREREREKWLNDPDFRRRIEDEVRASQTQNSARGSSSDGGSPAYDSSVSSEYSDGGEYAAPAAPAVPPAVLAAMAAAMNEAQIQEEVERQMQTQAAARVTDIEDRYRAFRYLVGSYQGSDYYFQELLKIHRYYLNAANAGDPIAQYHLALFLIYLGDIVDPYTSPNEHRSEAMNWLSRARMSDVTKQRVEEVEKLLADAASKESRRRQTYANRLDTLIRVEEEKIDMYVEVLIGVRERIQSGGGSGSGLNRGRNNMGSGERGNNRNSRSSGSDSSY